MHALPTGQRMWLHTVHYVAVHVRACSARNARVKCLVVYKRHDFMRAIERLMRNSSSNWREADSTMHALQRVMKSPRLKQGFMNVLTTDVWKNYADTSQWRMSIILMAFVSLKVLAYTHSKFWRKKISVHQVVLWDMQREDLQSVIDPNFQQTCHADRTRFWCGQVIQYACMQNSI